MILFVSRARHGQLTSTVSLLEIVLIEKSLYQLPVIFLQDGPTVTVPHSCLVLRHVLLALNVNFDLGLGVFGGQGLGSWMA